MLKISLLSVVALVGLFVLFMLAGPAAARDLKGKITTEQLYAGAPVFKEKAQKFTPDAVAVKRIGEIGWKLKIVMFLGTWCRDSVREAPKLLKMLEVANNPNISLDLYAVNTSMEDGAGLAKTYEIRAVPTIIFFRDGRELGRIKESPATTMENDFLKIIGPEEGRGKE
ncbi:MAG: thioredoxin family protein [Syntrophorhabdales bacterium]|jgi:thiol-disulfide isomerase/thioredoxin